MARHLRLNKYWNTFALFLFLFLIFLRLSKDGRIVAPKAPSSGFKTEISQIMTGEYDHQATKRLGHTVLLCYHWTIRSSVLLSAYYFIMSSQAMANLTSLNIPFITNWFRCNNKIDYLYFLQLKFYFLIIKHQLIT